MSTFNLLTKEAAKAAAMANCEITITSPQEANTKSSLIVVSNRLPFVLKRDPKTGKLSRHARWVEKGGDCHDKGKSFEQLLFVKLQFKH